jgi:hypothetical protein
MATSTASSLAATARSRSAVSVATYQACPITGQGRAGGSGAMSHCQDTGDGPTRVVYQGSSNSPAFAPATNASHSDSVKTRTVSFGPVYLELRMAM